jgi:hypothetical protein
MRARDVESRIEEIASLKKFYAPYLVKFPHRRAVDISKWQGNHLAALTAGETGHLSEKQFIH